MSSSRYTIPAQPPTTKATEQFALAMEAARENARRAGCDYVVILLLAGRAQYEGPVFWPLDLLIFPWFVIPDQRVEGQSCAVGWMIEVHTGRLVRYETTTGNGRRLATFMTLPRASELLVKRQEESSAARIVRSMIRH